MNRKNALSAWNWFDNAGMRSRGALSAPASMLSQFNREIEQVFDQFWRNWENAGLAIANNFIPNLDIQDNGDSYETTIQLPDFSEGDVEVTAQNGVLTISAKNAHKQSQKQNGVQGSAQQFGSFQQKLMLPPNITHEEIEASFKDGVLKISVPKATRLLEPFKVAINGKGRSRSHTAANESDHRKSASENQRGGGHASAAAHK